MKDLKNNGDLRDLVREFLEESDQKSKVELAEKLVEKAGKDVEALSEALESKEKELAQTASDKEAFLAQVEELKAKVEELEAVAEENHKSLVEAQDRATAAVAELASIAQDRALEVRLAKLEEAKVLRSGDKAEEQKTRVREMSDEEFAAYSDELISLRSELEESLRQEVSSISEVEVVDEVEVSPADLDTSNVELAGLNLEAVIDDSGSKWADFSKALSDRLNKLDK